MPAVRLWSSRMEVEGFSLAEDGNAPCLVLRGQFWL